MKKKLAATLLVVVLLCASFGGMALASEEGCNHGSNYETLEYLRTMHSTEYHDCGHGLLCTMSITTDVYDIRCGACSPYSSSYLGYVEYITIIHSCSDCDTEEYTMYYYD